MNALQLQPQSNKKRWFQSNNNSELLCYDLMMEILSFLPVKSLIRFKSVCKTWKTLISSNSTFIKLHLYRSITRNKHLALFCEPLTITPFLSIKRYPLRSIIDNTSTTLSEERDCKFQLNHFDKRGLFSLVASHNGLLCLLSGESFSTINGYNGQIVFYVWNPAMRTLSNKIYFLQGIRDPFHNYNRTDWKFAFGYDNSTDTYKIVTFRLLSKEIKVFNLRHNVWRDSNQIIFSPHHDHGRFYYTRTLVTDGVYVSGTVNWLVVRKKSKVVTIDQFVIISFDFSTETCRQLLPPPVFHQVSSCGQKLAVLNGSLCFSHDFNGTDLIIWQMKEFGVQKSWIQFLKINYQSLPTYNLFQHHPLGFFLSPLVPLYLSENDHTLLLAVVASREQIIIYNLREKRVENTRITNKHFWYYTNDYTESLVSIC